MIYGIRFAAPLPCECCGVRSAWATNKHRAIVASRPRELLALAPRSWFEQGARIEPIPPGSTTIPWREAFPGYVPDPARAQLAKLALRAAIEREKRAS